jgi:hypothetical protein
MGNHHLRSGGRYPVLRALAILQLVSAVVVGVGGVIAVFYAAHWAGNRATFGDKMVMSLGGLAATFFLVIATLAFAELIKLLIDIEHNTRMAALAGSNGAATTSTATEGGRVNRMAAMSADDETAEGALIRGH